MLGGKKTPLEQSEGRGPCLERTAIRVAAQHNVVNCRSDDIANRLATASSESFKFAALVLIDPESDSP